MKPSRQHKRPDRELELSEAEREARLRRAARALKDGVMQKDLRSRGFTWGEIERAREMAAEGP